MSDFRQYGALLFKSSHFELRRLRQLSELTRRLASTIQVQKVNYEESAVNIVAKKAKVAAEMFQADRVSTPERLRNDFV